METGVLLDSIEQIFSWFMSADATELAFHIFATGLLSLFLLIIVSATSSNPRKLSAWKLRIGAFLSAVSIIFTGTGIVLLLGLLLGVAVTLYSLILLVAVIVLLQWLISPSLIKAVYDAKEPGPELDWLRMAVEELAKRSGVKPPKVLVADASFPNAFAFGNALFGWYIAFTKGLLERLPRNEVIAVAGHEIGHLKHKDVTLMLAVGMIPTVLYHVGDVLSRRVTYGSDDEGFAALTLAGLILLIFSFLLELVLRFFNRLREFYADYHSAVLTGRPRDLERALARLYLYYEGREKETPTFYSTLMFYSGRGRGRVPLERDIDAVIERLKHERRRTSVFATHPSISDRLLFLDRVEEELAYTSTPAAIIL